MENAKILTTGKPFNPEIQGFNFQSSWTGKLNETNIDAEVSLYTKDDKVAILTRELDGSIYSLVIIGGNQGVQRSAEDIAQIKKDIAATQGVLDKLRKGLK